MSSVNAHWRSLFVYIYLAISFAENVVVLGRTDRASVNAHASARSFAGVSSSPRTTVGRILRKIYIRSLFLDDCAEFNLDLKKIAINLCMYKKYFFTIYFL